MDKSELRGKVLAAMAKSLWRLECQRTEKQFMRDGFAIPPKWADPWDESGCGGHQQKQYIEEAKAALDALHGIVRVVPPSPTGQMLRLIRGVTFETMAEVGDITQPKDTPS